MFCVQQYSFFHFILDKAYLLDATALRQHFQHVLTQAKLLEGNTNALNDIETIEKVEAQQLSAVRVRITNDTARSVRGYIKWWH